MSGILKTWNMFESSTMGTGTTLVLSSDKAGADIVFQFYTTKTDPEQLEEVTFSAIFEAKVFNEAAWQQVSVMNMDTLAMDSTVTSEGVFTLSASAYLLLHVVVSAVANGKLTVKAKVY